MFTATEFSRNAIAALGTVFFAGICLIGATAPAAAAEPIVRTVTVAYDDLNLANASGRNTLDTRIANAARAVCYNGSRNVAAQAESSRCFKASVTRAREKASAVTAS